MIKKRIEVASGTRKADLVLKNANIINVFTEEIIKADIAIVDGYVAGIGEYSGNLEVDLKGRYVSPGFIDAHVHIESSFVTPTQFAKTIIPKGTTTIIADPHEITNVCGLDGIKYILEDSEDILLDVFVMLPSCVPATSFENSGAKLLANDLEKYINHKRVLGLGELMDYVAVNNANDIVIDKLNLALKNGKIIDGHGPMLTYKSLNSYVAAGVKTEHECSTIDEMIDRIRLGMYVLIREGSAARNLNELIKGVNKENIRRVLFCTDDRHPEDILKDGHIDNNIRLAVEGGLSLIEAIKIATLNAAECYRLYDRGAVAPGYKADLIVFSDFNDFKVEDVYKDGILVSSNGKINTEIKNIDSKYVQDTINFKEFNEKDLDIKLKSNKARVIKLIDHSLITENVIRKVKTVNGNFNFSKDLDILKLVVVERHNATGNIGLGLVEGFSLKGGAIASTVAHDSHNLIIIGDNDKDIVLASKEIKKIGGGIVVVKDSKIIKSLSLPIAGLMSDRPIEEVNNKLNLMLEFAYNELLVNRNYDPFMTLAFLALPVIPSIKLTDLGLFDVEKFEFTTVEV